MKKFLIIISILFLITSCYNTTSFEYHFTRGDKILATFKASPTTPIKSDEYDIYRDHFLAEVDYIWDEIRDSNYDKTYYDALMLYFEYMDGREIKVSEDVSFKVNLIDNRVIKGTNDGNSVYIRSSGSSNSSGNGRRSNNKHYSSIGHSIGLGLGGASGALRGGMVGLL